MNNNVDMTINKIENMVRLSLGYNEPIQTNSYKGILLFLALVDNLPLSSITLDDNGIFHMSWRKSKLDKTIIAFSGFNTVDYLIFRNGNIKNGSCDIITFLQMDWRQG